MLPGEWPGILIHLEESKRKIETIILDFQITFKEFILIMNENIRRRKLEGKSTKPKVVQLLRELVPTLGEFYQIIQYHNGRSSSPR